MANDFSILVPKIISAALPVLREELRMAGAVAKDFSGAAASKGTAVTVPVPVVTATQNVTPGQYPASSTDVTAGSKTITINNWKQSTPFRITAKEGTEADMNDFTVKQIQEAVRGVLKDVNSDIFSKYKKIYGYAGTAGTNPFATTVNAAADARDVLNRQFCPDGDRWLAVGYFEETAALKSDDLKKMLNAGDANAMRNGSIGNLYGMNVFRDGQRPVHTAGTITTGLVAKAATAVAAGLKTLVATTAASTGACALLEGDVISIAGHTRTYVLTAAATQASAASDVTLTFEPGLEAALTGSEAITVKASHSVNIAFDPFAFGLVARLPADDLLGKTDGEHAPFVDPVTGFPLMISRYSIYHAQQWEVSALWGCEIIDARRACRLAGSTTA